MIRLARAQTARSQWASRIDRSSPIAKNIAAAIRMDSLFDAVTGKLYESGRVGTRKVVGAPGLGRGFGSTNGAGTTDRVVTSLAGGSGKRSYFILAKINGFGGGSKGRLFEGINTLGETLYVDTTYGLIYWRDFSGGKRTSVSGLTPISSNFGKVVGIGISADDSDPANASLIYLNGALVPFFSPDSTPSGSAVSAGNLCIGNRYRDNARNFDGLIYDFLAFDRMLLPSEHAALYIRSMQLYRPRKLLIGVTVQIARPIADLSNSGWVPSSGADLYPTIGETVRADATYIESSVVGALYECALTSIGDPNVSTGHLPTLVLSAPGGGGVTVRLRQGTTTIAAWTYHPGPTPTEYTPTLSGAEADSITDYTALRLQFEAIA